MKEKQIFVGIDVSKASLDICLLNGQKCESFTVKNAEKAIKSFFSRIQKKDPEAEIAVCMESTGYYNWPCYEALSKLQGFSLYVVNALHLKRSMGLVRGKSDKIDARRIADFIRLHSASIKPTIIPRKVIRQLQALLAHRNRLVDAKQNLVFRRQNWPSWLING